MTGYLAWYIKTYQSGPLSIVGTHVSDTISAVDRTFEEERNQTEPSLSL